MVGLRAGSGTFVRGDGFSESSLGTAGAVPCGSSASDFLRPIPIPQNRPQYLLVEAEGFSGSLVIPVRPDAANLSSSTVETISTTEWFNGGSGAS
jgi:hypothetical protein